MAKFHINPNTGEPGLCRAHAGNCPFGSADEHYGSAGEARQAYEAIQSGEIFTPVSRVVEPDIAIEANPSEFDTVSFRGFSRSAGAISAGAQGLMGGLLGGKSYSETIAAAKERASYAAAYFDKKAAKSSSSILDGNTSPANASVASVSSSALNAARGARSPMSEKVLAHATPSANPDLAASALAARGSARATSPIGGVARSFKF